MSATVHPCAKLTGRRVYKWLAMLTMPAIVTIGWFLGVIEIGD